MTNQKLIIYDFIQLYLILDELKDQINFEIINIEKEKLNIPLDNSLVITRKKIPSIDNQIILETIPIKLTKLIEKFNISFLKQKFSEQSEMNIGNYKINLNSREMSFKDLTLKLTEKESKVILFLSKSNKQSMWINYNLKYGDLILNWKPILLKHIFIGLEKK